MIKLLSLKQLRWYDIPNYVLNQLTVGDYALCHANLPYANLPRQQLDLYVPHHPRDDRAIILFVYGGSWRHGQKEDYIFLAQSFAKSGFYVASMNYRFAPEHKFPLYVEDVVQALNWLSTGQQAQQYTYNPDKIILMGHSAGAFNVVSALYHPPLPHHIHNLSAIYAVIGIAGPYSFEHRGDPLAMHAFAQDVAPEQIMPDHFVFKNDIRHLLLLAGNDRLVADTNTEKMANALQNVGNQVFVQRIPYTLHVSIIATVAHGLDKIFRTKSVIVDFIGA